jgi:hypothetical protein
LHINNPLSQRSDCRKTLASCTLPGWPVVICVKVMSDKQTAWSCSEWRKFLFTYFKFLVCIFNIWASLTLKFIKKNVRSYSVEFEAAILLFGNRSKRPHYQNAPTFYQNALTFYQNAPLFSKINYYKKKNYVIQMFINVFPRFVFVRIFCFCFIIFLLIYLLKL